MNTNNHPDSPIINESNLSFMMGRLYGDPSATEESDPYISWLKRENATEDEKELYDVLHNDCWEVIAVYWSPDTPRIIGFEIINDDGKKRTKFWGELEYNSVDKIVLEYGIKFNHDPIVFFSTKVIWYRED